MHHLSLILCLTHNRHAPRVTDTTQPYHLATERPRLPNKLVLDVRRNTSLGLALREVLRCESTVTDRAHVNFTGLISTLRRIIFYYV